MGARWPSSPALRARPRPGTGRRMVRRPLSASICERQIPRLNSRVLSWSAIYESIGERSAITIELGAVFWSERPFLGIDARSAEPTALLSIMGAYPKLRFGVCSHLRGRGEWPAFPNRLCGTRLQAPPVTSESVTACHMLPWLFSKQSPTRPS